LRFYAAAEAEIPFIYTVADLSAVCGTWHYSDPGRHQDFRTFFYTVALSVILSIFNSVNTVQWIKGAKDKLAGLPGENGGGQDAQKGLHSMTGRDETKRKTKERMERRSGKRSSSVGNEKMERFGDRQEQMKRYCATGQSPQRAVAPTEEEEDI
jgi:hypothetical protein